MLPMTRPRGLTATAAVAASYDALWYAVFNWTGRQLMIAAEAEENTTMRSASPAQFATDMR